MTTEVKITGVTGSEQATYFGYEGLAFPQDSILQICSCTEPSGECTPVMDVTLVDENCILP